MADPESTKSGNQPQTDGLNSDKSSTLKPTSEKGNLRPSTTVPTPALSNCKEIYEINIDTSKKLLPHVLVESPVSDIPLTLLVDSGSAICLLKQSCVLKQPPITPEPINIKGIDPGEEATPTLELKEGVIIDQHLSKTLLTANCLVKVKENKRVNIPVVNISNKPTKIRRTLKLKLDEIDTYPIQTLLNVENVTRRTKKVLDSLRTSHLNQEEIDALLNLCSDYSDIFHLPDEPLSFSPSIQHEIKTTNDIPIHTKSYRFPECHKQEVETQINKMLDQDIITPSSSPWSSPIWVVPKKADASGQKKWRIVIDYRKLNDITVGEVYPIPQMTEILDQLGKSQYFSTLDLSSGFHQLLIKPEDAPKTAFSVPQGHFQFNRMPFGLKNAPSTFQRLMNTCLTGLQGSRCFSYLDDIVLYAFDLKTAIQNLRVVFERLRRFNLKLQPEKCEFLRKEVTYLGHIITRDGVKPNPDKVKAVTQYPVPKSQKDIKSFLGLVSYYRRFIPDFSKLAKSLTSLLKKDTPFNWTNEQQLNFENLKNKLVEAPILIYPDFNSPFLLTCDASNYAISAILSQGPIGRDRPVSYASRTLNKAECNYSVTEKECLAIVFGTKTFRPYLYGRRFTIITDHKPLQWLFNCKDPGSRLIRWRLKLEEYDYDIKYKKGKTNCNADALSRFPVNPVESLSPKPTEESNLPVDPDATKDNHLKPSEDQNVTNPNSTQVEPTPESELIDLGPLSDISPYDDCPLDFSPLGTPLEPNDNNEVIDPLAILDSSNDDYPKFLKAMSNKSNTLTFNTNIKEHNQSIMKSSCKIIIIPTSIDLDESNPYIEEILSNNENSDNIINDEKELYTFKKFSSSGKTFYLLFTKVHHFDESSYKDIFNTLKKARDEIMLTETTTEIAITDFKNVFEKLSFTKIYNMINYLFHDTNIAVNIYHDSIIYPTLSEIPKILKENHNIPIAGHLGSSRMYNRIKEKYFWKGIRSDIDNYVKHCSLCQSNKALPLISLALYQKPVLSNCGLYSRFKMT
ncbi:uncharacterized protein LOC101738890 [Bombyx mori]|uniref:uncharacterized protein LOC101738890 n=1 Tax=Bombyx mori TaxID=7091 RepID=UPI002ED3EEDE